jgi:hypothetical protein
VKFCPYLLNYPGNRRDLHDIAIDTTDVLLFGF